MKTIQFKMFTILFMFFSLVQIQAVFGADDLPLKKDDGTGTIPNIVTQSRMLSKTSSAIIPVSASINGTELYVDFATSVGTAYISVVDANGSIVYQTVADTFTSPEITIPLDGLTGGNYSLKITYGTTKLIGVFQL